MPSGWVEQAHFWGRKPYIRTERDTAVKKIYTYIQDGKMNTLSPKFHILPPSNERNKV